MPEVRSGSPELDKLLVALKTPGIVGVDLMAVARWVEVSTKGRKAHRYGNVR